MAARPLIKCSTTTIPPPINNEYKQQNFQHPYCMNSPQSTSSQSAVYTLRPAKKSDAPQLAHLIMMAMTEECCRHFLGEGRLLSDFEDMMTYLAQCEDSQYSYRCTLCAVTPEHEVVGAVVGYDGAELLQRRHLFLQECLQRWGRDFSQMAEETTAGEFYIDSLAVLPSMRGHGVASALLRAVVERQGQRQPVALLVDEGNPRARALYTRLGFRPEGKNEWGGHPMTHMVWRKR